MRLRIIPLLLIVGLVLASCETGNSLLKATPTSLPRQDFLATFSVEIPTALSTGTQLALEWVNPVGVHELNPERLVMEAVDNLHFKVDVPVKKGAFLQYRYTLTGNQTSVETGTDGKPLITRFYSISNHVRIQDTILGFDSSTSQTPTGWIEGFIKVQGSQQPVSGILISIAGITGVSSLDGSFQVKKIPTGTHNLTIFSPNGLFEAIQQQATIEENNVTPIDVELVAKKTVNVTFLVTAPDNTPPTATIQLFGSASSLGNSFAGLFGGTNPVQMNAPLLTRQSETEYILVLPLPAETEITYLYSLGDTFWNKEKDAGGNDRHRTVFIPGQDTIVEDRINRWDIPHLEPVTFQFVPPKNTNPADKIQIQFNAFGWMSPLQMWPTANGVFEYQLFSPLNFSENINYRFCRSSICGTIDTATNLESTQSFKATVERQVLTSQEIGWKHFAEASDPTVVSTESSSPKSDAYLTAVELSDSYRPGWKTYYASALDAVKGLNANTVILPYTWTLRSAKPVWLAQNLAHDPTTVEIQQIISDAHEKGLKVYLKPGIQFATSSDDFWNEFEKTDEDWITLFDSISNLYLQTALLAQESSVEGIILGDEQTARVIGESESIIGLAETYPTDSLEKWNEIITKIKGQSHLPTYLALRFDDLQNLTAGDFSNLDGFYLLDLGQVSVDQGDTRQYAEFVGKKLDETLHPFMADSDLKLWIGLDFPSVSYPQDGCITYPTQCSTPGLFNFPSPEQPEIQISLQEQTKLYNAAIPEINRRDWISGISSRRFLIPVGYQDQSSSVRGKPAADVIWYWFSQMGDNPTE